MKQQISLKNEFYPKISREAQVPYELVVQALKDEPMLSEKEDYFFVGEDTYIRLKAALYLIGRFSITMICGLEEDIIHLSQPEKKKYSGANDERLPALNPTEQRWNDEILPIIRRNAKFLNLDFGIFLSKVYREMSVNFAKYTGEYLERIELPDVIHITKFRIITCSKELRIAFEEAMSRVMEAERYKRGNK